MIRNLQPAEVLSTRALCCMIIPSPKYLWQVLILDYNLYSISKHMKNMIKYTIQLLFVGVLFTYSSGCKKFLEEPDRSNFTMEIYFTKPEHAESAVNSIYESLRPVTGGGFNGAP